MVSGEIQPVPRHEDSGEYDQTAVLLVSIAASIQALSEAVDIVSMGNIFLFCMITHIIPGV